MIRWEIKYGPGYGQLGIIHPYEPDCGQPADMNGTDYGYTGTINGPIYGSK